MRWPASATAALALLSASAQAMPWVGTASSAHRSGPTSIQERADGAHPATVRIEVLEGRAQLVSAARVEPLVADDPPLLLTTPGYVSVRAASRLRLTWPGRASVLVHGPASLEWRPAGAQAEHEGEGRQASADTLELAVIELGELDVEVRRGTLELSLPESWRASLTGVAVQLSALPSGAVDLAHHAGPPIELEWTGERSASRPPIRVPAGSSVRLARPRYSPQEPLAEARRAPWPAGTDEWPWRAASDTPELRAARLALPRRTERTEGWRGAAEGAGAEPWVSHVASSDEHGRARLVPVLAPPGADAAHGPDAGGVAPLTRAQRRALERAGATSAQAPAAAAPPHVTVEPPACTPSATAERAEQGSAARTAPPQPTEAPRAPSAAGARSLAPPPAVLAEPEPSPAPTEARERAQPAEPNGFDPAAWRDTPRSGLDGVGPIAVQRVRGVEVRALSAGRVRVLVDASVRGPVWCFAPGRDLRLAPGATVVFEADGRERMRLGGVELCESAPGRPRWDALGAR